MAAQPAPGDAFLAAQLEESIRLAQEQRRPAPVIAGFEAGDDEDPAVAAFDVAVAARAAADREAAATLELEHVPLLEAVAEWSFDEAAGLVARPEAWARLLLLVQEARRTLADAEKSLVADLTTILPTGGDFVHTYEGVPAFVIRPGGRRRAWRHDEVIAKVLVAFADHKVAGCDQCGGTLDVKTIEAVVRAWMEVCSVDWKTGRKPARGKQATDGLRKYGVDPADHSEWVTADPTVEFAVSRTPRRSEPAVERRGPMALPDGIADAEIVGEADGGD